MLPRSPWRAPLGLSDGRMTAAARARAELADGRRCWPRRAEGDGRPSGDRKGLLGYSSVSRKGTRAWPSAADGFGPCMLLVYDSTVASSRLACQPCQVHGLVWVTRR